MERYYNHCTLIGDAKSKAEARRLPDGKTHIAFVLKVPKDIGKEKPYINYVRVSHYFRDAAAAKILADRIQKGTRVLVAGELHSRSFHKAGESESRMLVEVTAVTVNLLDEGRVTA